MPLFDFAQHPDGSATLVDDAGEVARRLDEMLRAVRGRSGHYRGLMPPLRNDMDPIATIGALPVTDKATYRTVLAREALEGLGGEPFVIDFSSGSTARPVSRFCRAVDDLCEQEATERAFRRAGLGKGDRLVLIDVGMAQISEFYARAARSLGVGEIIYLQQTRDLAATLDALRKLRPSVLLTIPSLLARAGEELSELWPNGGSPLRCVISTGEPMGPRLREAIKSAWSCTVVSLYGTTETGCLASECGCEDGHHFDTDAHVLSLRNAQRVDAATFEGELLLTTLQIHTQTVVKYAVGDIVRVSLAPCPCGEPTPRIWHLQRTQDAFVFAGEKFHHRMVLDALRTAAPDLDSLLLEIDDLRDGSGHVLLCAVVPEAFSSRRAALLEVLRTQIFELDSLVQGGLVRVEVECRAPEPINPEARKTPRIIDRRQF